MHVWYLYCIEIRMEYLLFIIPLCNHERLKIKIIDNKTVNILVNTDTFDKNMFKFIGPRVFNEIVSLDFYKRCNNKVGLKTNIKKYLIEN